MYRTIGTKLATADPGWSIASQLIFVEKNNLTAHDDNASIRNDPPVCYSFQSGETLP
jgi:hypothetical protein